LPILFILPDLNAGGAERIVTTIANHLPREKYSIVKERRFVS
jgi:hypothetical protein